MKADNDNLQADPLARLPLFATDREIAGAIVGRGRASAWLKECLPALEGKGFPPVDRLHKGRPVPLVKKFYDGYLGVTAGFNSAKADGEENWDAWKKSKRRA